MFTYIPILFFQKKSRRKQKIRKKEKRLTPFFLDGGPFLRDLCRGYLFIKLSYFISKHSSNNSLIFVLNNIHSWIPISSFLNFTIKTISPKIILGKVGGWWKMTSSRGSCKSDGGVLKTPYFRWLHFWTLPYLKFSK